MQYAIVAIDTRGGIQPYLALGLGLRRAGHDVRIVAPANYEGMATALGLGFAGLSGDVQTLLERPEHAGVAEKGFLASQAFAIREAVARIREWMREGLAACGGVDVLIAGIGGMPIAESVAEKLGVRLVQAHLQPLTPTAEFPGPLTPGWLAKAGRAANKLSHESTRQLLWQPLRPAINAARKAVLGLPTAPFWGRLGGDGRDGDLLLYGYSPQILPKPADWGPGIRVTGYWFLDSEPSWRPPESLSRFLEDGPPPVVVGFGSMGSRDAGATAALVIEAVRLSGRRAVLLSGWGGLDRSDFPDSVLLLNAAPHDWLLPRAAVAVHHGGAGTTGAALRAGIPSVVVPFAADQPFWGRLVAARKAGPPPIPRRKLTAERLAAAIRMATTDEIRRAAAEVGECIREERGVENAVAALESAR